MSALIGRPPAHAYAHTEQAETQLEGEREKIEIPLLRGHVNDLALLLSTEENAALDARLRKHEQDTGQQIVLLTVTSLHGAAIENYGLRVAEAWKLGQQKKDNGVLLLIDVQEHKIRIEVGYGLEGWLTDARSSQIIHEISQPAFRRGDFSYGIDATMTAIMQAAGAATAGTGSADKPLVQEMFLWPKILFLLLVYAVVRIWKKARRESGYSDYKPAIIDTRSRSFDRAQGGSGGLFGGGGFGGGGGGFGGGGASGGW